MGSLPCLVDWRWHYAYDHYLYHHYSDYHDDYGDRRRQHAALLQTWQPPLGHQDSGEIEDVQKRNFIRPTSDRCLALSVVESLNALVEIFSRFEVELTQPEVRFVPKKRRCCLQMISIYPLLGAKLFVYDDIKASHLLPQPVAHTLPVRAMEVSAKGSSWRNMEK